MPTLEISIPTTSLSPTSPPYTLYNITLRLPLRSFTLSKRYSDFSSFHTALTSQTTSPPPSPLPPKSWFANTVSNASLREERRIGLESYLRAINNDPDPQWRNSSAWRAFLNLPNTPSGATGTNGSHTTSARLHAAITDPAAASGPGGGGKAITDPTLWLDCFRDMKAHLHDARLQLTRRDQETTPQKQHESSAMAKSALVRAGSLIAALEEGLKNLGDMSSSKGKNGGDSRSQSRERKGNGWSDGVVLGDGELRRRKDLLVNARKEKDGLEDLLNAMAAKGRIDNAVASLEDKEALVGSARTRKPARSGRVLGKETERTRELDNQGVLQLQRETMQDQDLGLEELRKIVARQKELGIAINGELQVQNDLLRLADEDADRLQGKLDISKKRLGKIS
ncbi:Qc-SNARE protein [Aspergillus chevalieri]|uniref:SNARE complex subunit n=1 Tax=Aspergillus chevalieri TaxID=182096 RepID=A0A7R7ZLG1_ASPCH|nr:uncharacterized protein ACHE_20829A [Aspergillus chevalieri]BCR85371.1 hypothetical protein ACHE_20829A [Aspergillus chevalieri]